MQREDLRNYLDSVLDAPRFRDYCPNGLQVEGRSEICKIVVAVTAAQSVVDAAVACGADALLVHHGYFWRGEDGRITGIRKTRLAALLGQDINLFGYHLPLDAHPEWGNNAQLGRLLGWEVGGRFAEQDVGFFGAPRTPKSAADVAIDLARSLGREPLLIGDSAKPIKRIAWCSGGAQGYFEQAIAIGADIYVSGEISEQTVHLARESGVAFIAAGHHATERYGVQALAAHLTEKFGLECDYVEIDNPV